GKVMITVSGEVEKGQYKQMGGMEHREKRVPDPVANVGGFVSGNMSANQLKAQRGVFAVVDNFDFDLEFTVKKCEMTVIRARQDLLRLLSNSATLTPEMVNALNTISPKDKVFFDKIIASVPEGTNRRLNGVVIGIQ